MNDVDTLKEIKKDLLKRLPIWTEFDKLKISVEKLDHDLQQLNQRMNARIARIDQFPKLRIEQKPLQSPLQHNVVVASSSSEDALVKKPETISRTRKEERKEQKRPIPYRSNDPLRDEVILKLEDKLISNDEVYSLISPKQPWVKCVIICIYRRPNNGDTNKPIISFRLKCPLEHKSMVLQSNKFQVARVNNFGDKLQPPKRVIAGTSERNLMPGTIGHEPNEGNKFRYLVLLDDGSAQYYEPHLVFPIVGQSVCPWLDAKYTSKRSELNEAYCRHFFASYPRRNLIAADPGDDIQLMRMGVLVPAVVVRMDCDIMTLRYRDGSLETIYRGSPRLISKFDLISRQLARVTSTENLYHKIAINISRYYEAGRRALDENIYQCLEGLDRPISITKQHNTARKSTAAPQLFIHIDVDAHNLGRDESKVEKYDPVKVNLFKAHKCTPSCLTVEGIKTEISVGSLIDDFRDVGALKVPLLLGWKRYAQYWPSKGRSSRLKVGVTYEAPCGKILNHLHSVRQYLINTKSILDIDYFCFDREVRLNRVIDKLKAVYYVPNMAIDSITRKPLENKNIRLLNPFTHERLPDDFKYRSERFPHPELVKRNFSFNQDFKSCCDCEDDCRQRATCACHQLNQEFAGSKAHLKGEVEKRCQYTHKRLEGQISTGIFECNELCKCSSKCSNRVVQHGIKFRLQVQFFQKKGWGVIALDDIPRGSFICTYAAELLDDADEYGDSDMYYADLDYITVNEHQKEIHSDSEKSDEGVDISDCEDNSPLHNSKRQKFKALDSDSSDTRSSSSLPSGSSSSDKLTESEFANSEVDPSCSRYPKRSARNQGLSGPSYSQSNVPPNPESYNKPAAPSYKKIHDILDSHDYTLDARMQGNVGRFFNHSCDPNTYVQNVFIDTHDLRFPIPAFFSYKHIKALEEITWNYNYKMGHIEGRIIECHCQASNCRGRIL